MTLLLKAGEVRVGDGRRALGALPGDAASAALMPAGPRTPSAETTHSAPAAAAQSQADAQAEALTTRLAEIEQAYALLEKTTHAEKEAAYRQGMSEGIAIGEAQAQKDHAAQLDMLAKGVGAALQAFDAQLAALETLSLDIARAALDTIFGDPDLHSDLVVKTAQHHLSRIKNESALTIEVSPADFPEPQALHDAFAALAAAPGLGFSANPRLARGACLIGLSLGKLDASLPQQHSRIAAALAELNPHDEQPAS
ncbi:hypothetical protein FAZ69_11035 [Trinickia terrae]|uniref:Flagellar assembly protein FliH n=1 Tax=Trinickia terrae TaxID=2571161 RepID=A0A4U1I7R6_9BURK|nr:FliH/SctL family protein [Trinickia terrae]TKC89458.1 hypothetical protein FAZ69_11035 [Trinickia terrae]